MLTVALFYLGIVWAGAQPSNSETLSPDFLQRLHTILKLTDTEGIHVVLDNHGDMTTTAGCGNGIPMWIAKLAAPDLIGAQLSTPFPYSLFVNVESVDGFSVCKGNASAWSEFAGDPNYNLKNRCCQAMNSNNPAGLGYTDIAQRVMNYVLSPGVGRDYFVRFWKLIAEAVVVHPSASLAELMNEPMSIRRDLLFDTWRDTAVAINSVIPDMSVSVSDVGEGAIIPFWFNDIFPFFDISNETVAWIKSSETLFYAWHWYGNPVNTSETIANVKSIMREWNMPSFATEFMDCGMWNATRLANISHSYWHYSAYCNTGPAFGNRLVPDDTFGACILGWGSGSTAGPCNSA